MADLEENLERPPDFGSLEFSVEGKPASLQSSSSRRQAVKSRVSGKLKRVQYFLSDDVQIDIRWFIHERDRYESDSAPDIDNILKPLIDALCGIDGIIFDDCQVQAVRCYWVDSYDGTQCLDFSIKYRPHYWVNKKDLCFIHIGDGLCYPLPEGLSGGHLIRMTQTIKTMVERRNESEKIDRDYYQSRMFMPSQRVFHRTRVASEFEVLEAEDILN